MLFENSTIQPARLAPARNKKTLLLKNMIILKILLYKVFSSLFLKNTSHLILFEPVSSKQAE